MLRRCRAACCCGAAAPRMHRPWRCTCVRHPSDKFPRPSAAWPRRPRCAGRGPRSPSRARPLRWLGRCLPLALDGTSAPQHGHNVNTAVATRSGRERTIANHDGTDYTRVWHIVSSCRTPGVCNASLHVFERHQAPWRWAFSAATASEACSPCRSSSAAPRPLAALLSCRMRCAAAPCAFSASSL